MPKILQDKLNKVLLYYYRNTDYFGAAINKPFKATSFSKNENERIMIESELSDNHFIKNAINLPGKMSLTAKGMKYTEKLQTKLIDSKQVFVAIWYDESIKTIYNKDISRAITDSGYNPLVMYNSEFNEAIYDQIIGEIRKSKFIVADFTGDSPNVYFEAGFAYGCNLKVIYTCREDYKDKIKFDVKHNNFIFWKDGEDLYKRLKARIDATII